MRAQVSEVDYATSNLTIYLTSLLAPKQVRSTVAVRPLPSQRDYYYSRRNLLHQQLYSSPQTARQVIAALRYDVAIRWPFWQHLTATRQHSRVIERRRRQQARNGSRGSSGKACEVCYSSFLE